MLPFINYGGELFMNTFLAKSNPPETIMEHTDHLLREFETLKTLYPEIPKIKWEILRLACLYHDIGKMNTKFQNKLRSVLHMDLIEDKLKNVSEVPHGNLSVAFLPFNQIKNEFGKDWLHILCQSIYYHHARYEETFDNIIPTVNDDLKQYLSDFSYYDIGKAGITTKYDRYVLKRIDPNKNEESYEKNLLYIMTKGLLNRIDFAASAYLDVELPNDNLQRHTEEYINQVSDNQGMNDLQKYLLAHQDENLITVASTGIGKTEAALLWIGNAKGFFCLPLKVANNAIYRRIKSSIGFRPVGLLHSDTSAEYLKEANQLGEILDIDYMTRTKQFSLPLTVCTLDQLIDFVFRYEGYEVKLATLAYSKLVIDEVQMYSPKLLGYLIVALKRITELGGKFCILTATFPPILQDLMQENGIPFVKPQKFLKRDKSGEVIVRHWIKVFSEDFCTNHLKDICSDKNKKDKPKKVLVIVNTVRKAQDIYDELNKSNLGTPIYLLHSRFIKKDRAEKERRILEMGSAQSCEKGIWISTQIVEASLDIDFDVLYTELSEITGLFQRMGRVYRNRTYDGKGANVFIYTGDKFTSGISESKKSVVDYKIFQLSKEAIQKYEGVFSEEDKMNLVEEVYTTKNLRNSCYYDGIHDAILQVENSPLYEYTKGECALTLRDIYSVTVIPLSIKNANEEIFQAYSDKMNQLGREKRKLHKINNLEERKQRKQQIMMEQLEARETIKQFMVDVPMYAVNGRKEALADWFELNRYEKIPVVNYQYSYGKGLVLEIDDDNMFF